jgi:glycosyltransferase involved in cell wall biosynthesis
MHELVLIMPVYNEEGVIVEVLNQWLQALNELKIDFVIHAFNDGSKDSSLAILKHLEEKNDRIIIFDKPNSGHGPTIIEGFLSAKGSNWIFQVDSDDEVSPDDFPLLWNERNKYDFLIGRRTERNSPAARRLISYISRSSVKILYGKGVWDVNSPFRLLRQEKFDRLFNLLPKNTFAPNVIISGYACWAGLKIYEVPIKHQNRKTGAVSIRKFKLLKSAMRSFWQTIKYRKSL